MRARQDAPKLSAVLFGLVNTGPGGLDRQSPSAFRVDVTRGVLAHATCRARTERSSVSVNTAIAVDASIINASPLAVSSSPYLPPRCSPCRQW